jgi:DNA polymerase-1
MQLVDEKIVVWDPMKEKFFYEKDVYEKFGVMPNQIIDYLSIVGDTSDFVPGVKGIGEKGAVKLLLEYRTLENIYNHLDDLSDKTKTLLLASKDNAFLSKRLVTLYTELNLHHQLESYNYTPDFSLELKEFLLGLGFKSVVNKYFNETAAQMPEVNNSSPVEEIFLEDLKKNLLTHKIKSVAITIKEDCVLVSYNGEVIYKINSEEQQSLILLLEKYEYYVFVNNAKELLKRGIPFLPWMMDLSMVSFYLDSESSSAIDFLYEQHLGVSAERATNSDLWRLGQKFLEELEKRQLKESFFKIDMPLLKVIHHMEKKGIEVDCDYLAQLQELYQSELQILDEKIKKFSDTEINLKSPKQVGFLLFEKLSFPVVKATKTGPSTDSSVLEKLVAMKLNEVPGWLLEYREIDKLLSTYITVLPKLAEPVTCRLHTTYHLAKAATGRLTSENPNLQNIPIKTKRGSLLRKAFIAKDNYVLLSADYSQIELRILAHFCGDKVMTKAFEENQDIHIQTAAKIFNKSESAITPQERYQAKTINFGLIYGQSSYGLAETLHIPQSQAREFIEAYFKNFSSVKAYLDSLRESCEKLGYASTMLGRRRYLPDIKSSNRNIKNQAERMAINTPIQGTAADIIKLAMNNLFKKLNERPDLMSTLLLQVHDELIVECPEKNVREVAEILKVTMEQAVSLSIPLKVDVAYGRNWLESHEI